MKTKKKNKTEKLIYTDQNNEKYIYAEINKTEKKVFYYIRGGQGEILSKIIFDGYTEFPTGFYLNKKGYGFPGNIRGYHILDTFSGVISPKKHLELVIRKGKQNSYREYTNKVSIQIKDSEFKSLIETTKRSNSKNVKEIKEMTLSFLSNRFPSKVKKPEIDYDTYKSGDVAEILSKKNIKSKLDEKDLEAILDFFPQVFQSSIKGRKGILKDLKLKLATEGKKITDKIFLDEVIKEFQEQINRVGAKEEEWQIFLKNKVFPFLTNYIEIIDKENIGVDISYPDFVLINIYGFADIFEIKTHKTKILSYDKSHNNYHWSIEITKAISQVENYIDALRENESQYIKKIKRTRNIDISINRPKGFIIAGTHEQITEQKAKDDLRRLRHSHKNIEFILYDEILKNLESIQSKLQKSNT